MLEKTFLSTARRMEPSFKLRAEAAPLKEGHRNTSHAGVLKGLGTFYQFADIFWAPGS